MWDDGRVNSWLDACRNEMEMNTAFKNDLGIWVDEAWGVIIGHALFIEALCPAGSGRTFVSWKQPNKTRLGYNGGMPLYYGVAEHRNRDFHLYGVGEAAWGVFHAEHVLSDLLFPVDISGFVVIIEKRARSIFNATSAKAEKSNNANLPRVGKQVLEWIGNHKRPFVVAATGYEGPEFSQDEFHFAFGLEPDVPVLPGPSTRDSFNPEYAKQVLATLAEQIEVSKS